MHALRLRQAVVAAADRAAVVAAWRRELGLGRPFADPGVELFGLHNAVVPVGDAFLEVVSPLVPGGGCPAERYMAARGAVLRLPDGTQVEVAEGPDERLAGIDLRAARGVAPRSLTVAGTIFRIT